MTDEIKTEAIAAEHGFAVRRLPVPGGWLYITRTLVRQGYGAQGQAPTITVATTFVPDPYAGHVAHESP